MLGDDVSRRRNGPPLAACMHRAALFCSISSQLIFFAAIRDPSATDAVPQTVAAAEIVRNPPLHWWCTTATAIAAESVLFHLCNTATNLWHGRVNGNGDRHGRGVLIWDVENRCEGECVNSVEQGVFEKLRGAELEP